MMKLSVLRAPFLERCSITLMSPIPIANPFTFLLKNKKGLSQKSLIVIASHDLGRPQEKIRMTSLKMHLQFNLLQGRHCKGGRPKQSVSLSIDEFNQIASPAIWRIAMTF